MRIEGISAMRSSKMLPTLTATTGILLCFALPVCAAPVSDATPAIPREIVAEFLATAGVLKVAPVRLVEEVASGVRGGLVRRLAVIDDPIMRELLPGHSLHCGEILDDQRFREKNDVAFRRWIRLEGASGVRWIESDAEAATIVSGIGRPISGFQDVIDRVILFCCLRDSQLQVGRPASMDDLQDFYEWVPDGGAPPGELPPFLSEEAWTLKVSGLPTKWRVEVSVWDAFADTYWRLTFNFQQNGTMETPERTVVYMWQRV